MTKRNKQENLLFPSAVFGERERFLANSQHKLEPGSARREAEVPRGEAHPRTAPGRGSSPLPSEARWPPSEDGYRTTSLGEIQPFPHFYDFF